MQDNPYVGPRPYERDDRHNFFGRGREARDLLALMLAERVLLFYAQSGAGKTSLLNAQVIPSLEEKGLNVLPVARVGSDLPPGIDPTAVSNVFVFSALMGLAGADVAPETLLEHTLHSFLETRCCIDQPPLLILDQFEELFTTHRDRWQEARDFFVQLRQVLDGIPKLGVTLAMREDHIAELDPYAPLLPGRLRARFRMERLGPQAAVEAVAKPAANAGCPFDPGVAERLVDDLRRIKTQEAGSRTQEAGGEEQEKGDALGPYVEPVQLQVVCNRLWERLPDHHDGAIQWEKVEQYGNIDRALVDFYESALSQTCQVADATSGENLTGLVVTERQLRRWFSEELITPMETRGLAMRGRDDTAGLPNAAVDALEAQHLIRADVRAGARWYELCHDRMVEPIVQSNRGWEQEQENLHPWRPVARQWEKAPSETLLYRGKELEAAKAWLTAAEPDEVEGYERAFIEASGESERGRVRRRSFRTAVGVVGAIVILAMAALTVWAFKSQQAATRQKLEAIENQLISLEARSRANRNAQEALISQLSTQARAYQDRQYDLASLLSVETCLHTLNFQKHSDALDFYARNSLLDILQSNRRIISLLHGHRAYVGSVAFSPDGAMLASGSGDNSIILWDMGTRQSVGEPLRGHDYPVMSVSFSPDGTLLASGSADRKIIVWDITTRQPVGELSGYADFVASVAFSPGGRTLASGSFDGTIMLWDMTTQPPVSQTLGKHNDAVVSIAFSPDGMLTSGSLDGTIRRWDVQNRSYVDLGKHKGPVLSVASSTDGTLASGSVDNSIILWKVVNGQGQQIGEPLVGHTAPVLSVAFSRDGKMLASAGTDNTIVLWNVETHEPVNAPLVGHSWMRSVAFSPDGKTLASGSSDKDIILWDVSAYPPGVELLGQHNKPVLSVAFAPDGKTVASGGRDNTIVLWDIRTRLPVGEPLSLTSTMDGSAVYSVAFTENILASGSDDGTITLWDVTTHQPIGEPFVGHGGAVLSVASAPDGQSLASGSGAGTITLWNLGSAVSITLTAHREPVASIAFAPNGETLASASWDNTVVLWDLATGEPSAPLVGHGNDVLSVAFAPDGKILASGGQDNKIILWDMATRSVFATLTDHTGAVSSLAFAPDGKTLASGSFDQTIILWDVATRQRIGQPLTAHLRPVRSLAFSIDGKLLVSADDGGQVILWNVAFDSWIEQACHIANRNFTPVEWVQFFGKRNTYRNTCDELPLSTESIPDLYMQVEDYLISRDILPIAGLASDTRQIQQKAETLWNHHDVLLTAVAAQLGIEPATAAAVVAIEGDEGFDTDNRMIIRFENHVFYDRWGKRNPTLYEQHFWFDPNQKQLAHYWRPSPDMVWQDVHANQESEWEAFMFAQTFDKTAAMESIGMGMFQIMGSNYRASGYTSAEEMFNRLSSDEAAQLDSFFKFIKQWPDNLPALQKRDFLAFARSYNGPEQGKLYSERLKQAYDIFRILTRPQSQ